MVGSQQCLMISLTLILCLVPTVQHPQSMSRRVRRPTRWNVKESEKAYTMELAAPGIKKEYCRVGINDEGNLTIAIENKQEHKHEDSHRHYLRREFSYSNYEQNYTLPDDVVRDKISAKVEDGILTITMPKTEPKEKVTKAIEVS